METGQPEYSVVFTNSFSKTDRGSLGLKSLDWWEILPANALKVWTNAMSTWAAYLVGWRKKLLTKYFGFLIKERPGLGFSTQNIQVSWYIISPTVHQGKRFLPDYEDLEPNYSNSVRNRKSCSFDTAERFLQWQVKFTFKPWGIVVSLHLMRLTPKVYLSNVESFKRRGVKIGRRVAPLGW